MPFKGVQHGEGVADGPVDGMMETLTKTLQMITNKNILDIMNNKKESRLRLWNVSTSTKYEKKVILG